jgi:metal-responsive CopG/Arc/MetJ family transcriptional regulator
MPKTKVALTLDAALLDEVDALVAARRFRSRSQAVEAALADKVRRLKRTRLARECAKADPAEEHRRAEEWYASEAAWPEY